MARLSKSVLIKKILNLLNLYEINNIKMRTYLKKESLDTLEMMTWYTKEELKQYVDSKGVN